MTARQKYRRQQARTEVLRNIGIILGALAVMAIAAPIAASIGAGI